MNHWWLCLILIGASCVASATSQLARADEASKVLFESDVLPILEARCLRCHGGEQREAGLDLRRRFLILQGGDSGPALLPGDPDQSLLIQKIASGEMPPDGEDPLDATQKMVLTQWVAAGAHTAASPDPPLDDLSTAGRVSDQDRDFPAFQTPRRPIVPEVADDAGLVRNPIDAFLLARLNEKGLGFNPEASPEVLLRRVTFDLTGLPPTIAEREQYLADNSPDAWDNLVERLLASPRYGERWARHWLDTAGYADSDGYLAADRLRPEAWRYRDWVIRALNQDLPYDEWVTQQLAGDELSDWRRSRQLSPETRDQLVATGFLRTASDPTYPGYIEPNEVHQVMADTLQIVGSTFLGLTIQCARCHQHKSDPISQRDYYSLLACFQGGLDPARWQPSEVRGIRLVSDAEDTQMTRHNAEVDARVAALNESLQQLGTAEQFADEAERLRNEIAAEAARRLSATLARGFTDLDESGPASRILIRGSHEKPGAQVTADVPEVLVPPGYRFAPQPGNGTTGRRLALARWLTSPEHPLLARVHVNRIWAAHFGRGIVPTLSNFGHSGVRPSHPELLDWLAVEFREPSGAASPRIPWSQKQLHRLMVTSAAYRQSADIDPRKASVDPENLLLGAWQPRRHQGEVLRDTLLAVSGRLNLQQFGTPAGVVAQNDGSVIDSDDDQGRRRSIYQIVRRSQHLTLLELFDTPVMEVNCPERPVSTVPLQALALLHGPAAEHAAAGICELALRAASDPRDRISFLYRQLFAREPHPGEVTLVQETVQALLNERLSGITDEANGRAAADRAAWRELCLVLLNSNEFVYVH